jgi:hypothetical protein
MRRGGGVLLVALFFVAFAVSAQSDDPSEIFLKAYLSAQQGEKLERQDRFKSALAKYRFAGSLIEQLRKDHPDWQAAIVEYRGRKISEGILRIQERITRQDELSASASPLPEVAPSLPESEPWSEPGPEVVAPKLREAAQVFSLDEATREATKKLRAKVEQLQAALEQTRSDLQTTRKEKEALDARLRETSSNLNRAQSEIEKPKKLERDLREQLAQTEDSLKKLQASREADQLREISEQTLLAENEELKRRLANAERGARELAEKKLPSAQELGQAKRQLAQLQQQIREADRQNQYFVARIVELRSELDEASSQLRSAKLAGANDRETSEQLARENELLRSIIAHVRHEEARRHEAGRLAVAELDKLKIKSDLLSEQIELLTQPVTRLTSQESALLQEPTPDHSPSALKAGPVLEERLPAAWALVAASGTHTQNAGQGGRRASPGDKLLKSLLDLVRSRATQFTAFGVILVVLVEAGRKITSQNAPGSGRRRRCAKEKPPCGETLARSSMLATTSPHLVAGWTEAASQANGKELKTVRHKINAFDEAVQKITAFTNEERGHVATTSSQQQPNGKFRGEVIIKLPPENLDRFLQKVRTLGGDGNAGTVELKNAGMLGHPLIDMLECHNTELSVIVCLTASGGVENVSVQRQGEAETLARKTAASSAPLLDHLAWQPTLSRLGPL